MTAPTIDLSIDQVLRRAADLCVGALAVDTPITDHRTLDLATLAASLMYAVEKPVDHETLMLGLGISVRAAYCLGRADQGLRFDEPSMEDFEQAAEMGLELEP